MDTLRGALECVDIATGELHRPEHVPLRGGGAAHRVARKVPRNRGPGSWRRRAVAPARNWPSPGRRRGELGVHCWYGSVARARYRALSSSPRRGTARPRERIAAEAVEAVLHQRALQGFNATLRPYLYVHKGATQGFLALFRAWSIGTHVGTAQGDQRPRVPDRTAGLRWLTLLGYPPSPCTNLQARLRPRPASTVCLGTARVCKGEFPDPERLAVLRVRPQGRTQ